MKKNETFVIEGLAGARVLAGDISVGGAKNAVLKALAATVLFADEVRIENAPDIEDVRHMSELLRAAGAEVSAEGHSISVRPPAEWKPELERTSAERMRSSVVLTGPMLARTGKVVFPFPGGCVLGERPIDLFLQGFRAMGAEVEEKDELFHVRAAGGVLSGARIFFPVVSVTATETLMLAACLAKNETVLENAAMEPEIPALAEYLNACGANITGVGTPTLRIQGSGGEPLSAKGTSYRTPPDRIEAGSFVILGALAGKKVTVRDCEPRHMDALLSLLARAGVPLEVGKDFITVTAGGDDAYVSVSARTHEYPGFPTDLQAPYTVFLTQCAGEATVLETIFDSRFRYTEDLARMGANITVMNPHKILVKGPRALSRKELEGPDLRAGLAYILAVAVAEGTSSVSNAYVIDRGYEKIEERLQKLGLNIKRVAG